MFLWLVAALGSGEEAASKGPSSQVFGFPSLGLSRGRRICCGRSRDTPDLRATCPPPLLVGGVYGGREGAVGVVVGRGHFAPLRGSQQPSGVCARCLGCRGRNIVLASCLRQPECVRVCEPSLFCKVSVRLRGEENDPRAWCRGGHRWGWGLPG